MSNPTIMAIAPLTTDQIDRWKPRFDVLVDEISSAKIVVSGLRTWADNSDTFLSDEVQDAFWHAMMDWELFVELSQEFDPSVDDAVLVTRKLAPMAVLLTGLGWPRARRLPGIAGFWMLDADGARAAAQDVEEIFALDDTERAAALERMDQAFQLGDADLDLENLLDMVPRAFADAVGAGQGLVCCSVVAS